MSPANIKKTQTPNFNDMCQWERSTRICWSFCEWRMDGKDVKDVYEVSWHTGSWEFQFWKQFLHKQSPGSRAPLMWYFPFYTTVPSQVAEDSISGAGEKNCQFRKRIPAVWQLPQFHDTTTSLFRLGCYLFWSCISKKSLLLLFQKCSQIFSCECAAAVLLLFWSRSGLYWNTWNAMDIVALRPTPLKYAKSYLYVVESFSLILWGIIATMKKRMLESCMGWTQIILCLWHIRSCCG